MASRELEELLALYFDRSLEEEGAGRLEALLEADPAAAARFRGLLAVEGLLSARDAEAGAWAKVQERVMRSIRSDAEARPPSVVERVMAALPADPRDRVEVPPRQRRSARLRLFHRGPSWMAPALIAAGLLFAVALVLAVSATRTAGPRVAESPRLQARDASPRGSRDDARPPEEKPHRTEAPRPPVAEPAPRVEDRPREKPSPPALEPAPRPEAPAPEKPKDPEAPPQPAPQAPTESAAARLERAEGRVFLVVEGARRPVQAPQDILPRQGIETESPGSLAVVAYPDKTRLEAGPGTELREIAGGGKEGKRLHLAKGVLAADVTRQPAGKSMVIATPHGEAQVLGTALRLVVDASSTRLEVTEGRVQFRRSPDGKTVDVVSGHYAVASAGPEFAARPLPRTVLLEDFENARGIAARWETLRSTYPVSLAGRLEIDLTPRPADPNVAGWGPSAGLKSRQAVPLPMRVTADFEATDPHEDLLANIVFTPAVRDEKALFRVDRRNVRGGVVELRDVASSVLGSSDLACRWPGRERWSIEVDADRVRAWIDGREALDSRHGLKVHAAYFVTLQANARASVPSGARVKFDNVRLETQPR